MAHATVQLFESPPPWSLEEGPKGQISINLNYEVNFIIFKQNCVCLLTNERYKTYRTGFTFDPSGHAPGAGLGGSVGGW